MGILAQREIHEETVLDRHRRCRGGLPDHWDSGEQTAAFRTARRAFSKVPPGWLPSCCPSRFIPVARFARLIQRPLPREESKWGSIAGR